MRVALLGTRVGLNPLVDLTPRQSQMLSLLAKGKTYDTIAEELGVSYKTVVNTCLNLKRRLGAKNLSELIRAAVCLLPAEPYWNSSGICCAPTRSAFSQPRGHLVRCSPVPKGSDSSCALR